MSDGGGWFVGDDEPIPVAVGCFCPGAPHPDGDTVYLRPELDAGGGFAVTLAMQGDAETLTERLGRAYLEAGIVDWTFVDAAGAPVPVTRRMIRRLRWNQAMYTLADRASDLYGSAVLDPLVAAAKGRQPIPVNGSSPNGRTPRRTSRTRTTSGTRQRP